MLRQLHVLPHRCCWLVAQSPSKVQCTSQGEICSDNRACYPTVIEASDQNCHLTQPQRTDTGPTSPSADPITLGAWQDSRWSAESSWKKKKNPWQKQKSNPGLPPSRKKPLPLRKRDGAATQRKKLEIKLSIVTGDSLLAPGRPVPALTL